MPFGFALHLQNIDLWYIDLLDTDLDLLAGQPWLDTDIPSKQDMSSRHLQVVSSVTIFCLPRHLEVILKTSSRRLARCLEDVKTSWRRLQDIFTRQKKLLCWRRAENVFKTCLEDVLKTSWRPTNVCWVLDTTILSISIFFIEIDPLYW